MQSGQSTPCIIDIEASGFGTSSYPIEIGVVRDDGERFCRLIKPYPEWQYWDKKAEALHGISRETLLQFGVPGRDICCELNQFLNGKQVYSDGWVVDNPWLIKLYAHAGMSMTFKLSALEYILSESQMQRWQQVRQTVQTNSNHPRHRASADAEVIQQTYKLTSQ